jgi:hypothetical protein
MLTVPSACYVWARLGEGRARAYMRTLSDEARALLLHSWGLENIGTESSVGSTNGDESMRAGCLTLVPLPGGLFTGGAKGAYTSDHAAAVQDYLHHEHRIEVPAKCVDGRLYLRISSHVHNCLEDYQHLAEAVLSLRRNPMDGPT